MKDRISSLNFLVDTGADITVIPKKYCQRVDIEVTYPIRAVNGNPIHVYGVKTIQLDINLGKKFIWNAVVADLSTPILGGDFLEHFHILPDLAQKTLVDGKSLTSTQCTVQMSSQQSISLVSIISALDTEVQKILEKYPDLLKPPKYREKPHDTYHYIETTGTPVYQRPYRIPPKDLVEVKKEYQEMNRVGIVRPSNSAWASPLVIVSRNGKKRYCGNFRRLNAQTIPDRYPVPNITDCSNQLYGKKLFSKIDLVKAYHNIPVYPEHVSKTAVISQAGLFEYIRMPFGLKNAPSTWMRFITTVLGDLPFIFIYFDDILVFSETLEQHLEYLDIIFNRLNRYNLTINNDKSKFCCDSIEFLGFEISAQGIQPSDQRIQYIKDLKQPKTVAALRKVLGVFSFYRRFVQKAAEKMAPLYDQLKGRSGKNDRTPIKWTPHLEKAFVELKSAFVSYTLLNFLNNQFPLQLKCDASGTACGGVLEQIVDGHPQPIAFYSQKLKKNQLAWSTYDKELYALYACVSNLEHLIQGYELTLITDHRPLLSMFSSKKRVLLERRSRYIEFISQFTTKIEYTPGPENIVADALSRPEVDAITRVTTFQEISEAQREDGVIDELRNSGKYEVREIFYSNEECSIFCVRIQDRNRIIVPKKLRYRIFRQLHGLSHPGNRATIRLVSQSYFWPGMQKEIRQWSRSCASCQKCKITRHTKSPLEKFPESDAFEVVHTDIVVLPEVEGFRYLISFIDRATRWMETKPLQRITTEDVAKAFIEVWISRFGTPLKLVSDRGPQYRAKLFKEIGKLLGVDTVKTTAYNPKCNGIVERMQKTLKSGLKCRGNNWLNDLPFVLLGLRTAVKEGVNVAPAEMVYGRAIRVPGEFYQPNESVTDEYEYTRKLRQQIRRCRPAPFNHKRQEKVYIPADLKTCKKVYVRVDRVRLPLEAPYEGPYEVKKRGKKYFRIEMERGDDVVSIDRLKPAYELSLEEQKPSEPSELPSSILKTPNFDVENEVTSKPRVVSLYNIQPTYPRQSVSFSANSPQVQLVPRKIAPVVNPVAASAPVRTKSGREVRKPERYAP